MRIENKIDNWVKNISKDTRGGNEFFDKIDDKIKTNNSIILSLFNRINLDYGFDYNLVVSGGFASIVSDMISKKEIICKGTILFVSGGITSHLNNMDKIQKVKEVNIRKQIGDIENKDFIFVDDSYYSGTTEFSINHFLKQFKSRILKTYVVYDGNDKKSKNRISIYNYYDWNKGSSRTPIELLEELSKYDVPRDAFEKRIISGEITSIIQLRKEINSFLEGIGEKGINIYSRVRESFYIKRFFDFNI